MADAVKRLRELSAWLIGNDVDMKMPAGMIDPEEAADEIDRLRADLAAREAEVARLRETLKWIDQRRWEDRSTINPDNAFRAAASLNAKLIEIMNRAAAALTAPSAPESRETDWRPIEEAPRDGTPFLAWNGHWRGVAMYFEARYEGDIEWVDEQTNYIEPEPTHWMPLPPPPKKEGVEPLGSDFEAVWDANRDKLYEP